MWLLAGVIEPHAICGYERFVVRIVDTLTSEQWSKEKSGQQWTQAAAAVEKGEGGHAIANNTDGLEHCEWERGGTQHITDGQTDAGVPCYLLGVSKDSGAPVGLFF
jgi:hypothetical protein